MKKIYVNWEERLIISNEEEVNEIILLEYTNDDEDVICNYLDAHYTPYEVWNFDTKDKLGIAEEAQKWAKKKAKKEFLEDWDEIVIS